MSDAKSPRRRARSKQVYRHHKNAVSVTAYDPTGATIPADVRKEIEGAVFDVALANKLLINIAYE